MPGASATICFVLLMVEAPLFTVKVAGPAAVPVGTSKLNATQNTAHLNSGTAANSTISVYLNGDGTRRQAQNGVQVA